MAQILKVMLWKTYILRKRRWFVTLMEFGVPILVFGQLIYFNNLFGDDDTTTIVNNKNIMEYDKIASYGYLTSYKIAYSPSNNVTNTIMSEVLAKLTENNVTVTMSAQSSGDNVVQWLKSAYINETEHSTSIYATYTPGVGVIFTSSNGSLEYTLRTTYGSMVTSDDTLYGEQTTGYYSIYYTSGFAIIQALIDQAYLTNYHNIDVSGYVYTEQLPSVDTSLDVMSYLLPFLIAVGFTFALPSLLQCIVEEKTSGVKEMMRIMGLPSWINWINWLFFTLILFIPVSIVVTYFLVGNFGSSPVADANPFIIWLILMLFMVAFITFIFALSTLFTNGTLAVIVGMILWYAMTLLIDSFITVYPDEFSLSIHLVTCLLPTIPLLWVLNTISNFQTNGESWTVSDFWDDGAGGGRVSVGLAVIMLLVDVVLYSIIAWYVDNVNPGPYGRAKPFYFMFQCFKKKSYDSATAQPSGIAKNYEAPPRGLKAGLRIEGLRKTFNRGKVVAVDHVDLDIYEGNITVLLGHNGAGKTTTMSMITGFFSPSKGKVIVNEKNIFDSMDDFRSSLGLCPQDNLLFSYFTVIDHLIFFGMLKGLTWEEAETKGMEFLRILKMEGKKDEPVSRLSGGMKRKLCLTIALVGDPNVLVLDEPTSGLDPESRRDVWDMLLGFRGNRTTIITTHFMEEADVLGDRIAIMNHGRVSCYGTPMFLKKLYGAGYHLNISKEEQASIAPISSIVSQHLKSAVLKINSDSQITYNSKSDESVYFSVLFAELERFSSSLGIHGITITCTTMEDVFLRVAEKPEEATDNSKEQPEIVQFVSTKYKKVYGSGLVMQQLRALIYKRLLSVARSWISSLIYIVLALVLTWFSVYRVMEQDYTTSEPSLLISLSEFSNVKVAVSSTNSSYTSALKSLISDSATYVSIPNGTDLNYYMDTQINSSLVQYERLMMAGFEVNSTHFVGAYSIYFDHSPAIVLNLIANTLLQMASNTSSITVTNYPLAVGSGLDICELAELAESHVYYAPMLTTWISIAILIQGMMFISFPLKERVSKAKQLQLMTGVSPALYWSATFLCDYSIYLVTAIVQVGIFCVFQQNNIFTASGYMGTLFAIFILYGFSGISFSYFFSFLVGSSVKASVIFIMINFLLGTVLSVLLGILESLYTYYSAIRFILSFNPVFSASYAFFRLIAAMYIDGTCNQCGEDCTPQDPLQYMGAGTDAQNPYGILNFLIFLIVDAIIYFALVLLLEYGVFKKLSFIISKMRIKMDVGGLNEDEDVRVEKESVTSISQGFKGLFGNTSIMVVDDLAKKYNQKSTAVHGVSFQVGKGECFGLLGVNGAGKTTTFKMLTGEEIPNQGDAAVLGYSLQKNKSQFLARIGYCPQFDAINKQLSAKQMLRVYALLRGIPSEHCDYEVSRWVQIMGLQEYADRPCGTYSGGNKRKLSTAMAFIGEPPVVFLDEPTSGVDPVSRRRLWDIMSKCQESGQSVVLTSHSMEECEALCSRLTIMVGGRMRCVGSAPHLKLKFGQGYTLKVKLQTAQTQQDQLQRAADLIKQDLERHFFKASIKDEHLGLLHYHIPDPSLPLSQLFTVMEGLRKTHPAIEDYIVSDTTLEEVFMSFARGDKS